MFLSPVSVPAGCSTWSCGSQALPQSVAEMPLATPVTVSGAAGGISLSMHSKELHFINHFDFATFTLFSLSGASKVPFLFFQATRNGAEMWGILPCLINCGSEVSLCS